MHTHTQSRMLDNIRLKKADDSANPAALDQLAQIKVKVADQNVYYSLYWCTKSNMVLVQRDQVAASPCYWACNKLSIADILTHFHNTLNVHVTETWTGRDYADAKTIADLQLHTIRNRHHVASIDCEVA